MGDRIGAGWRVLILCLSDQLWGHGLSIRRLLRSLIFLVLFFALIYWGLGLKWNFPSGEPARELSFLKATYAAVVSLVGGGFGDISPTGACSKALSTLEFIAGILFLGLFVAAAYRKISR